MSGFISLANFNWDSLDEAIVFIPQSIKTSTISFIPLTAFTTPTISILFSSAIFKTFLTLCFNFFISISNSGYIFSPYIIILTIS